MVTRHCYYIYTLLHIHWHPFPDTYFKNVDSDFVSAVTQRKRDTPSEVCEVDLVDLEGVPRSNGF